MNREALRKILFEEGLTASTPKTVSARVDAYKGYKDAQQRAMRLTDGLLDLVHTMFVYKGGWDDEETGSTRSFDYDNYDYIVERLRDAQNTIKDA